ncbi:hypothetical protein, partial [Paraburkholderia sp. RL17-373-BIF-A]|uniref:hypothetical protein n=1 Tax=Paraburkholderia sp. RL17-373-BIF-A TaxID=3031629 RepID=UPI0038B85217
MMLLLALTRIRESAADFANFREVCPKNGMVQKTRVLVNSRRAKSGPGIEGMRANSCSLNQKLRQAARCLKQAKPSISSQGKWVFRSLPPPLFILQPFMLIAHEWLVVEIKLQEADDFLADGFSVHSGKVEDGCADFPLSNCNDDFPQNGEHGIFYCLTFRDGSSAVNT